MTTAVLPGLSARPGGQDAPPNPGWMRAAGYALLACLAYIPILLTSPGKVVADTKSYLYLDPGRLLQRAPFMWTPNIALGTLPHQQIGYLFPSGPYYWAMHMLGVPAWVSQRIWFGTILLAAALGVLYLLRTLHVRGPGVPVAMVLFMLSPYVLNFADRISALLLPMAGLPWMLALTIRALRDREGRGWKYPALFALVVLTVGSINFSSLFYAGIAPVLWIVYAVVVTREIEWRRALVTTVKIGALTLGVSLWWISALVVESRYGTNLLLYTETLRTVAQSSSVGEVLRGLGYWFFYGRDKLGPRTQSSVRYVEDVWLILVSYAIPVLALLAASLVRWRHRAYFIVLALVGVVIAVGPHPYDIPSVWGAVFKSVVAESSFGLALRNGARAVPLIALAFAVLIGVAVNAAARSWDARGVRVRGLVLAALLIVLALANMPSLFDNTLYGKSLLRNEDIPQYWTNAIAALDAQPHDTRILEIPGSEFSSYRWGDTLDPITPFLTDRPYVARELVAYGSEASANLLAAFDRRLQEAVLEPEAIAPIARVMSVGDVVYRADLQTDRYDLARAVPTWLFLTQPTVAPGLDPPTTYGDSLGPALAFPKNDEVELALPPDTPDPAPVSIFPVQDAQKIVRTASSNGSLIVSGDGDGLIDLGTVGALDDPHRVILYAGSYAKAPAALRKAAAKAGAVLVVTDSNRKRPQRWGVLSANVGATERANEKALSNDETDQRLEVFPGETTDSQTVVESPGATVSSSGYDGNFTLFPELRAARAFDGDLTTSWQVGSFLPVLGDRLRLDLDTPITTGQVHLVQPQIGNQSRFITKLTLTFDGKDPVTVDLHDASLTAAGETVTFPTHTFHRIEMTIADTNVGDRVEGEFTNNVGFAEVGIKDDAPGSQDAHVDEIVRMPTDLVDAAGSSAAGHALVYSMSRSRSNVIPPRFSQDEVSLIRKVRVPDARTFGARGAVRLATDAPDDVLDSVLGIPDATHGGITVRASFHLPGDVAARGSAAFDGDPTTAWNTGYSTPANQWLEFDTPTPVTFDHMNLQLVADGRHSVPTQIRIDSGPQTRTIDLPPVADQAKQNATVTVPVSFDPITASSARITITQVREVPETDYYCECSILMPAAIAEVGIPGVQRAPLPAQMPAVCRTDLLTVDGEAVGVRMVGSPADAEALRAIDLQLCDAAKPGVSPTVALGAGDHVVRSQPGKVTGVDFDRFVLGSDAAGAPMAIGARGSLTAALAAASPVDPASAPTVRVTHNGATTMKLEVSGAKPGAPFWLVLGQSNNAGWQATVAGESIGGSTLVDGYANGWLVHPTSSTFSVTLDWTPQQQVWIAIALSLATILLCLFLALRHIRLRRRKSADVAGGAPAPADELDGEVQLASPLVADGTRPSRAALIAGPIVAALVGAVVARWWIGGIAAVGVLLVLLRPRLRSVLTIGAPLALGLVALYVAGRQFRDAFPVSYNWPQNFDRVNDLAWLAVILLACDALVEMLRTRPWRGVHDNRSDDHPDNREEAT